MNISLFNRKYWVRRFGEQRNIRGHITTGHRDFIASLNVHPSGRDVQENAPEGERRVKRLEAHGTDLLVTADQETQTKGDLLWYRGEWYECIGAQEWDHTVLSHLNYEFVLVPHDTGRSIDLENPPDRDPETVRKGEGLFLEDGHLKTATDSRPGFIKVPAGSGLEVGRDGSLRLSSRTAETLREKNGKKEGQT